MTGTGRDSSGRAAPAPGEVDLYLPDDWIDLLADGTGPETDAAAQARFFDLAVATYPGADRVTVEAAVDGLMAWRALIIERGMVSHGVVNCPVEAEAAPGAAASAGGWASWHVLTAVVQVPPYSAVDPGELLAGLVGAHLDPDRAHARR